MIPNNPNGTLYTAIKDLDDATVANGMIARYDLHTDRRYYLSQRSQTVM
jgi:hypothetical protein